MPENWWGLREPRSGFLDSGVKEEALYKQEEEYRRREKQGRAEIPVVTRRAQNVAEEREGGERKGEELCGFG